MSAPILGAQQQERTLIDRLLRPDMELQNNAQGKKFPTRSIGIEHSGTVGTFFLQPRSFEKSFADSRTVGTKQFSAASSPTITSMSAASFAVDQRLDLRSPVPTSNTVEVYAASDAAKQLSAKSFTDQRPFRQQGKSQKLLDRHNPPLTIEQVRELLNKNK